MKDTVGVGPLAEAFGDVDIQPQIRSKPFYFQVFVKAEDAVHLGVVKEALEMDDVQIANVQSGAEHFLTMTGKIAGTTKKAEIFLRDKKVLDSGHYTHRPSPNAMLITYRMFSSKKPVSGLIAKIA